MTDIVMNLFIFFFISFSLIYTFNPAKISKIDVRLPKAFTATAMEGSEKVALAVTREGRFFINDEAVKRSELKPFIASRLKDNPELGVVLKVDGSAKFENVVTALDVLNDLDIRKVSVASVNNTRGQ